jgi:hypothetical protein
VQTLTNGNPGGNDPKGNLAVRSPALSFSAASRNAATKAEYASQNLSRAAFVTAWQAGAGDFLVWFGRV